MQSPGKRLLPCLLSLPLAVAPGLARGAERQVRWEDLVALLPSLPSDRESASLVAEADGAAAQARQLPNPTVEGTLAHADEPGDEGLEWGASVSVPLGWLARRGPAVDAADASVEEARHLYKVRRLERLDELRELFYGLVHDQEHVASVEAEVEGARELTRLVQLRVKQGDARPIEALQAETELARDENELERTRADLEGRRDRLRLLIPELGDDPVRAIADLETAPPPDLSEALVRLRGASPSIRAAAARVRAAEAELSAQRRERIPDVAVGVFTDRELDKRATGGTIELTLPLLSWNGGGVRRAESTLAAAEAARETALREAAASFAGARRGCERERRIAARYGEEIVPRAEQALAMLEKTFRVGEATLPDVFDARRVAGQVRREALESRLSAKLACERVAALLPEK